MNNKQLDIALGVWLIGVVLLGGGFYFYHPGKPLIKPVIDEVVEYKPIVVEKPVIISPEDLGQPSTGTTHIQQSIISETDNPYSMTDAESVSNFNSSTEGQFLQTLFAKLNSPKDTIVAQRLDNLMETDLSTAIQISPELQRMFYGYGPSNDPKYFLYDKNLMHQYQPHAALLYYIQGVRPDSSYQAQMRGSILPEVSKVKPSKIKVAFGEREVMYLVRQSVGTCLVESVGSDAKYFEVSFQFNLGIPHDVQTEGYPLLLWPSGMQITIKPIDLRAWETDKKVFYVKG